MFPCIPLFESLAYVLLCRPIELHRQLMLLFLLGGIRGALDGSLSEEERLRQGTELHVSLCPQDAHQTMLFPLASNWSLLSHVPPHLSN